MHRGCPCSVDAPELQLTVGEFRDRSVPETEADDVLLDAFYRKAIIMALHAT